MYPTICTIGPFTIYSYGLMLAVAVFFASFLASREAPRAGIKPELIFDLTFWVILFGLLGARIFYILLDLSFFMANPLEMIMIQKGGLAWQGGLILGTIAGIGFVRKKGLPLLKMLDFSLPYVALGQAIGRLGCFLNGCCYGKEVSWGVFFPIHQARLHPTQLYEFLGLVVIFFILKGAQRKSPWPGKIFLLYLVLASILRFAIEFIRADQLWMAAGLSLNQWISLGLIAASIPAYFYLKKK